MKLKEVCEKTGLTQKTIRFYEERGLIAPSHSTKNGRSYRDYSDRDVVILNEIATLRKALFTLDEIATIQKDPASTLTIFVFLLTRKQSYTETWNHIRCWLIPLDLIAIILRLTVSSFQAIVSAIKSHVRPNKDSVIKSSIASLLIILSILGGTFLASSPVPEEETEYTLVICCEQSFDQSLLEDFQHMLTETVMEDASGRRATITTLSLQNSDDLMTLKKQLSTDACSLYLFDQTDYQIFIEKLAVPSELEFVPQDLSDAPFVTQFGVEDLLFWGCVIDTGNSTDAAVMLERLQTAHFAFWYPR